jgi:hypothetical protein
MSKIWEEKQSRMKFTNNVWFRAVCLWLMLAAAQEVCGQTPSATSTDGTTPVRGSQKGDSAPAVNQDEPANEPDKQPDFKSLRGRAFFSGPIVDRDALPLPPARIQLSNAEIFESINRLNERVASLSEDAAKRDKEVQEKMDSLKNFSVANLGVLVGLVIVSVILGGRRQK